MHWSTTPRWPRPRSPAAPTATPGRPSSRSSRSRATRRDQRAGSTLREHVARQIGKLARPAEIIFALELPKTRSGKIMRRLLKNVAENEPLGDTSTLLDPSVVETMQAQLTGTAASSY